MTSRNTSLDHIRTGAAGLIATSLVALAIAVPCGCYRPQGALIPGSGDAHTYYSTQTQPKSIVILDLRSDEVVFSMSVPPGKQLSFDFVAGAGDDPVYTPDLMRYEVFDIGTMTGKLRNAMSVPNAACRRIDVSLRPGPEYATAAPDRALRTDELEDRPSWWTPRGGELPEDEGGTRHYDK